MASPQDSAPQPTFRSWLADMPRWKKIAVGVAAATMVAGGILWAVQAGATPTQPVAGPGSGTLPNGTLPSGLVPDNHPPGTNPAVTTEEPAAKGVFRLGFSFVAGFCIGSFLRAMIKVAAIAFGFWLLFTMLLTYLGVMNVDWTAIEGLWDRFAASVSNEWGSFQTFMTGSLPAAGLAATGLAVGLKRN